MDTVEQIIDTVQAFIDAEAGNLSELFISVTFDWERQNCWIECVYR